MIVRSLDVRSFRCIRQLHVDFAVGLNVLYGSNELGKSTMVEALRAAFLLPVNSKVAEDFVPWGTDETPEVVVEFELPPGAPEESAPQPAATKWRIKKSFGRGRNQSAILERITGQGRSVEKARGRDVDGHLRSLLDWGIQEPGGRGAPRGWPQSYLITALLGEQDGVAKIFESSLDSDGTDSGRNWLTTALGVLAQAPEVTALLERLNLRTREVFTDKGQKRRTQDSPLVQITDRQRNQQRAVEKLEDEECRSQEIEHQISSLRKDQQRVDADLTTLTRQVELLTKVLETRQLVSDSENRREKLKEATDAYQVTEANLKDKLSRRQEAREELQAAEEALGQAKTKLAGLDARLKQLNDTRSESLESRRQHLKAVKKTAQQSASDALRALEATREVQRLREDLTVALQNSEETRRTRLQAVIILRRAFEASIQQARNHVAQAESVAKLARLKAKRNRLQELHAAADSAQQELDRLHGETEQVEEEVSKLKSERINLQKTRNESLDAEKQAWEERQKRSEQRRMLDDELRRAEDSEQKARRYLKELDQLDEITNRLSATKQKQRDLTSERETAEQNFSHLKDELGAVAVVALRWQVSALVCAAFSFLMLVLGLIMASDRVGLFSAFGALGIAAGVLAVRWRRESQHRHHLSSERDAMRQKVDRLESQGLIADSEVDAAQREFDACQRSMTQDLRERFDNFTEARAWLDKKLHQTVETRSHLEAKVAKLEELPTEPVVHGDEADSTATLDARIQKLDEQIAAAEETARTLRTQRDQAHARSEQACNAAFASVSMSSNDSENSSDSQLQVVDSQISHCIRQLEWPEDRPIPTVEDAEHTEALARQTLLTKTSAFESRVESLTAESSPDSQNHDSIDAPPDTVPLLSVEEADQRWRIAKDNEATVANELKQHEAELKAKEASADQLARELEKPADQLLNEANEALARVDGQLSELKSGRNSSMDAAASECDAASKVVTDHQKMVTKLYDKLKAIDDEVSTLQESRDATKTARDKMEEHARHINSEIITSELLDVEQNLTREFPDLEISVEQLERSRMQCNSAVGEQERVSRSLHEARGKLELSGGEVLRDRLESARNELERIEAEAIEQELEYDALYYLQQTLQDASQRHSAHLGKSLAQPVSAQFRALTGNRYADLHFEPDLQLKMVTSQNSERSRDTMSVGTRHQLATLIRLALGVQLQTTVVLDDQLVHSDTDRLFWFCKRLRQVVTEYRIQAIIVTCRPHDYVTERELELADAGELGSELENLHIINVERCFI